MNAKLITAMRRSARALESFEFDYEWKEPSRCCCGVLFCALLDCSAKELARRVPLIATMPQTWTRMAGQYCAISGKTENELFKELLAHGLTVTDMRNLEFLSDPKVLARVQLPPSEKKWWHFIFGNPAQRKLVVTNQFDVARYLRAWADLLTEEGQKDSAPVNHQQQTTESHHG